MHMFWLPKTSVYYVITSQKLRFVPLADLTPMKALYMLLVHLNLAVTNLWKQTFHHPLAHFLNAPRVKTLFGRTSFSVSAAFIPLAFVPIGQFKSIITNHLAFECYCCNCLVDILCIKFLDALYWFYSQHY